VRRQSRAVAKVPDGLDLVEASALPLATTTGAELIAIAAGVKTGQSVLVSGAFGGVGGSAIFTAKERGAKVIAGVLKKQLTGAANLGADEIMALDDEATMKALAPVDVVANAVRGKTAEQLIGKVKAGGVFASVTGPPANAKDYPSVKVVPFVSSQDARTLSHMAEAVAAGKLVIPIDRTLPLKDAAEAHALVGQGGTGKVLLAP
jgi:NADPH:quinone reductase-like Zn-dependent oxidoreductase